MHIVNAQKMTVYSDFLPIPDRYIPVVLARARYYAWQYKENYQQAGFAADDYRERITTDARRTC